MSLAGKSSQRESMYQMSLQGATSLAQARKIKLLKENNVKQLYTRIQMLQSEEERAQKNIY